MSTTRPAAAPVGREAGPHASDGRESRRARGADTRRRVLLRVDLLIVDDFALQPLDALDTADIYELVESGLATWPIRCSLNRPSTGSNPRHTNSSSTVSPTGNARSRPSLTTTTLTPRRKPREHHAADAEDPNTWSHATGEPVVSSRWRATTPGSRHSPSNSSRQP
jgi:hypothetical protein